jgi:tetratricopeptide (TPR) repeat protein
MAMILPAGLFVWRFPPRLWADARLAPASVAAVLLTMYIIDCLLNGFVNLIYITLAGGLMGFEPKQLRLVTPGTGEQTAKRSSGADQLSLANYNYNLGRALKAKGKLKEAEAVWRQSLDLLNALVTAYPNNLDLQQRCSDCANDLVWLWVNYDIDRQDLNAAVTMAQWIVEVSPHAAIYWNTLGVAHYRVGDDASAITALNRATILGGSTPFNEVFLAMAYARSGDRAQAEIRLAEAISQMRRDYPEHPELNHFCDEARSMLTEGTGEPSAVR